MNKPNKLPVYLKIQAIRKTCASSCFKMFRPEKQKFMRFFPDFDNAAPKTFSKNFCRTAQMYRDCSIGKIAAQRKKIPAQVKNSQAPDLRKQTDTERGCRDATPLYCAFVKLALLSISCNFLPGVKITPAFFSAMPESGQSARWQGGVRGTPDAEAGVPADENDLCRWRLSWLFSVCCKITIELQDEETLRSVHFRGGNRAAD
jgi:hypothetical protein